MVKFSDLSRSQKAKLFGRHKKETDDLGVVILLEPTSFRDFNTAALNSLSDSETYPLLTIFNFPSETKGGVRTHKQPPYKKKRIKAYYYYAVATSFI